MDDRAAQMVNEVNSGVNHNVRDLLNAAYLRDGQQAVNTIVSQAENQLNHDGLFGLNLSNNIQVERQNGQVTKVVRSAAPFLPGMVLFDSRDLTGQKPPELNPVENFLAVAGILGGVGKSSEQTRR